MSRELDLSRSLATNGDYEKAVDSLWKVEPFARRDLYEAEGMRDLAATLQSKTSGTAKEQAERLFSLGKHCVLQNEARTASGQPRKFATPPSGTEAEFWASPAGKARAAFSAGDRLLQVTFDAMQTQTYVIPMSRTGTTTRSSDPTAILNSICNEGWQIVNGSFVFLELGSESRDKFMRSGQDVAVRGTVIGYYLFQRDETMLPARAATATRECPDCAELVQPDARICRFCRFNFEAGIGADGVAPSEQTLDEVDEAVATAALTAPDRPAEESPRTL